MEIYTVSVGLDKEKLLEDFTAHGVTAEKGFIFDGASAPRIFWAIIPPFKRTKKASCIHDWLCSKAEGPEDRLVADKLFRLMLKEVEISVVRSTLGYWGVRLGSYLGIGVRY